MFVRRAVKKRKTGPGTLVSLYRRSRSKSFTASLGSTISRAPRAELKYLDTADVAGSAIANAGNVTDISKVPQGITPYTRVGRQLNAKYIQLRIHVYNRGTYCPVKWWLVYDAQPSGTTVGSLNYILDDVVSTNLFFAFKQNAINSERFIILRQGTLAVNDTTSCSAVISDTADVFVRVPRKLQSVRFADDTARTPVSGAFYLCFASYIINTTNNAAVAFNARFAFVDP